MCIGELVTKLLPLLELLELLLLDLVLNCASWLEFIFAFTILSRM